MHFVGNDEGSKCNYQTDYKPYKRNRLFGIKSLEKAASISFQFAK